MPQPDLNSSDYYAVLGCSRNADENELKKAYRKLAVKVRNDPPFKFVVDVAFRGSHCRVAPCVY